MNDNNMICNKSEFYNIMLVNIIIINYKLFVYLSK